jgi:hypothetical protein
VFWIIETKPVGTHEILITNLDDTGKKRVEQVTRAVERDFVYPLIRGKDVSRWKWSSGMKIILPQDPQDHAKAIPERKLKKEYPGTYGYLKLFEADVRGCALLTQFFNPENDPFYSSYNVGSYTFQPFKVVWKEIATEVQAAVVHSEHSPVVPDHKLVMVGFDSVSAAHFFCAVINSSPVRILVRAYAVQTSISGHVCEYAILPAYESRDALHKELASLSRKCHAGAAMEDLKQVSALESDIDKAAARLWGITDDELKAIQEALAETGKSKGSGKRSANGEDEAE